MTSPEAADPRLIARIEDLIKLPAETFWVEFKASNNDPEMIGKLISALSNAARLADQPNAYVVWGVRDDDHAVIGTHFAPSTQTHQREPLEFWLARRLQPGVTFSFQSALFQGAPVVLLEIPAAAASPVEFDRTAYIRIGSATPRLADHPERQRALWTKLQPYVWEAGLAASFLSGDETLDRLDYASYFELTGQPLPDNRVGLFEKMAADRLVLPDVGGRWSITNLGAMLFAKRLNDFSPSLARKAVRFVAYDGPHRAAPVIQRREEARGYACGFAALVEYIDIQLPHNEHIGKAFRTPTPLYPAIAIRELVANALIHQDMTITGAGPLIEKFSDRLEFTNPGEPLMSPDRFLDLPPRSRNEALAALMRRMRLCEEQGTGIDKVIVAVEFHQLPPPDFRAEESAVRATLFAPRRFADMIAQERVRACYQHAALKYVSGQRMKNSTLCERFGIASQNAAQASGVIRQALDAGLIRSADLDHPRAGYVPFWA